MDTDPEELRRERLTSPFDPVGPRPPSPPASGGTGSRFNLALILAIVGIALGLGLAYFAYQAGVVQDEIRTQISAMNQQITQLVDSTSMIAERLKADQERLDSMTTDLGVLGNKLGVTTRELERARAESQRLRQEQQKHVVELNEKIQAKADALRVNSLVEETGTKFEVVDKELTDVKSDLNASRVEIEKTWQELKSLGLQVTDQGNLIATNATGLDELRKRGERDYSEFDARKKQQLRVSGIVLELRKADQKRQRADVKLYYDDREVEKKQVYSNNPIQFYVGRNRLLYEFVINEVRKDEILGYVSTPKGAVPAAPELNTPGR